MEENKDNILKKGLLKTDASFTSNLMDKINAEESALSNVLARHGQVAVSDEFTVQLMSQLEGKEASIPYKPVISKKAWLGIAAVFIGLISLTLFSGTEETYNLGIENNLQSIKTSIGSLTSSGATLYYIMFGTLLLSFGLIIEQKLSRKI